MKKKIITGVLTLVLCFTAMLTLSACGESALSIDTKNNTQFALNADMKALATWTLTYNPDRPYYIEKNKENIPDIYLDGNDANGEAVEQKELGGWKVPIQTYSAAAIVDATGAIAIPGLRIVGFNTSTATADGEQRTLTFVLHGESISVKYTVKAATGKQG